MTASTSHVVLEAENRWYERKGVLYVEQAHNDESDEDGVVLQYIRQDEQFPNIEFIPNTEIVGVYDEVAKTQPTDEWCEHAILED